MGAKDGDARGVEVAARAPGWEADYADRLVAWMALVAERAGATGAVFGVSGGVDSAVVAGLCVRAFPGKSLGLFLPCGSASQDRTDAYLVAQTFGLPLRTVQLDAPYQALLGAIAEPGAAAGETPRQRLALANLKVRLRAITWYYFANRLGRLVVGTGNRSELSVGYFTKYGDGAADILPLANLVKSEVRALARHLGVPEAIITRTPTAGLWTGQTDEGEMGVTYELLDRYLLGGEVPPEVADRIGRMVARSEHKRRLPLRPDF